MGRHTELLPNLVRDSGAGAGYFARRERNPYSLPFLSFWVALAIVLVTVVAPDTTAYATTTVTQTASTQHLPDSGHYEASVVRDGYHATKKPAAPAAPAVGTPDPGTAQAIAYGMLQARGWGDDQFACLVTLWNHESNWNVFAENKSSGAYGIPQALPGTKMASAGADWATNPATQITWGLGYIEGRYSTPCGAWEAFQDNGWY